MSACWGGHTESALLLFRSGASLEIADTNGCTALSYALECYGRAAVCAAALLDRGARVDGIRAAVWGHLGSVITKELRDPEDEDAAARGATTFEVVVPRLVSAGADLSACKEVRDSATLLMWVAGESSGAFEVRFLCAAGADARAVNAHGATALHFAAELPFLQEHHFRRMYRRLPLPCPEMKGCGRCPAPLASRTN